MRLVLLIAAAAIGLAAGIGGYTFVYAKGASYLSSDPAACVNCHVMRDQFAGWEKSSHRAVAGCGDCHMPHSLVRKYLAKARNGWHHSYAFTTGRFPDPIRITGGNREITEETCRDCHAAVVHQIDVSQGGERVECLHCHRSVGHLH
jgi:cytochrome c nitrite reductase small subunit